MMNATATYIGRDAMGFHRIEILDGEFAGREWCVTEPFDGERTVSFDPQDQFAEVEEDAGADMEFCRGCEAPLNADGTCARC